MRDKGKRERILDWGGGTFSTFNTTKFILRKRTSKEMNNKLVTFRNLVLWVQLFYNYVTNGNFSYQKWNSSKLVLLKNTNSACLKIQWPLPPASPQKTCLRAIEFLLPLHVEYPSVQEGCWWSKLLLELILILPVPSKIMICKRIEQLAQWVMSSPSGKWQKKPN